MWLLRTHLRHGCGRLAFQPPTLSASGAAAYAAEAHHGQRQHAPGDQQQQTQQEQQAVPLKAALRALYKRVHPDLFADFPAERAENERSFKLLQEYLGQARAGDELSPAARTPYRFLFFLRQREAAAPGDAGASDGEERGAEGGAAGAVPSLQRVELTLPPPERGRTRGQLTAGAAKALGRLLGLCGLPGVVQDEGMATGRPLRLLEWLPEAAEEARQREMRAIKAEVRVANLRGAMRLGRQVVVGFGAMHLTSGPRQVQLLEALARVLEEFGEDDLVGSHILFGDRTGLDQQGTLWLDASAGPEEWADFLGGVDLGYADHRRRLVGAVRNLERGTAHAAGLGMVYTAAPVMVEEAYRSFLERLAAHAAEHGHIGAAVRAAAPRSTPAAPFAQLPLYVAPPWTAHSRGAQGGFQVSDHLGYVQVPIAAAAHQVYGYVLDHGRRALAVLAASRQQAADLAELVVSARRRLALRRLTQDDILPPSQFRACCQQLLAHRDVLQPLLDGLSVRVSDANRVAPDGSCIDIAWNFEL